MNAAQPRQRNLVLLALLLAAVPAVFALAFVRVAPNRLVTGEAVMLLGLASPARHALWLPAAVLVLALFAPAARWVHAAVSVAAALLLTALFWLAGDEAARQSAVLSKVAFAT